MTRFIVENHEIILPDDYSFADVDENVLLTEVGEYTLDFDISLLEPANSRALAHINRLNKTVLKSEYEAVKITDGVQSKGKFLIITSTDTSAKCQFVAGKSEVNYVASDDKKIWELDFGTETEITFERALDSVTNPGIEKKFCCIPVKYNNMIGNEYKTSYLAYDEIAEKYGLLNALNINNAEWDDNRAFGDEIPLRYIYKLRVVMNPYLYYYVTKLPEILGYTIGVNVLENDSRILKMILINRSKSLKYSDALPDMTIREFISEIEKFFNVVFEFTSNKILNIVRSKTHIQTKKMLNNLTIVDKFEREPNSEAIRLDATRLSYNIDSKFQKINDDIVALCSLQDFPNLTSLKSYANDTIINKFNLFTITNKKRQYIHTEDPSENIYRVAVPGSSGNLLYVNKFRDYVISDKNQVELNLVPAELERVTIELRYFRRVMVPVGNVTQSDVRLYASCQMPVVGVDLDYEDEQSILDAIEGNLNTLQRSDKLEVVLYNGRIKLPCLVDKEMVSQDWQYSFTRDISAGNFNIQYPFPFVDELPEFWLTEDERDHLSTSLDRLDDWILNHFSVKATSTMSIANANGVWDNYYENENSIVNTDFLYKFVSIDNRELNSSVLIPYNGQTYIPLKIERTRSKLKSEPIIYCFRLKS